MTTSKAQQKAVNKYNDKTYDNLTIRLPNIFLLSISTT